MWCLLSKLRANQLFDQATAWCFPLCPGTCSRWRATAAPGSKNCGCLDLVYRYWRVHDVRASCDKLDTNLMACIVHWICTELARLKISASADLQWFFKATASNSWLYTSYSPYLTLGPLKDSWEARHERFDQCMDQWPAQLWRLKAAQSHIWLNSPGVSMEPLTQAWRCHWRLCLYTHPASYCDLKLLQLIDIHEEGMKTTALSFSRVGNYRRFIRQYNKIVFLNEILLI